MAQNFTTIIYLWKKVIISHSNTCTMNTIHVFMFHRSTCITIGWNITITCIINTIISARIPYKLIHVVSLIKQMCILQGCLEARCRRWIRIHERNDWAVPECPAWTYVLFTWDDNLNHISQQISECRWYLISGIFLTVDQQEPMTVQFISYPFHGSVSLRAGPAQFGYNLKVKPPVCNNKSCTRSSSSLLAKSSQSTLFLL